MSHAPDLDPSGNTVEQASSIAMDRYELSHRRALGLLTRLARHHKVELRVVAAAIVAAAIARRNAAR